MSLVRLSSLKGAIHGVTADGGFVHEPYDARTSLGRTEDFAPPEAPDPSAPPVETSEHMDWRELDWRGFPRDSSNLAHLVEGLVSPTIAQLGDQPTVILIHGFLFDPRDSLSTTPKDSDNPHARLFHFQQNPLAEEIRHHTTSWPLRLGFTEVDLAGRDGLAVAYGWHSYPGFAASLLRFQNFYSRAYENAGVTAWNLLTLLHLLDRQLPAGKRIDLFCHSLGSRVVIRMLALAARHQRIDLLRRVDRVLMLGGSEYVVEARLMLKRLKDCGCEDVVSFYNFVSRENDVLDKLGENAGPVTFGNSNVIGHNGLDVEDTANLPPNWLDFQIDGHQLQAWLSDNKPGVTVTGDNPDSVWDHWYYFTDPGNMDLYRRILREREDWIISDLRAQGIPRRVSKRRSIFGD